MRRYADFVPPKPHPILIALFQRTLAPILRSQGVVAVDYDETELARYRDLANERILLTPNHPTNVEPALLFHLSATVGQWFYYLACRESFDPYFGLWGALTRRLGAYSVIRGTLDRASFKATRELLQKPAAKIVIFPEGEVYSQNDTLLPFHDGAFQLAFWALDDLRKSHPTARILVQPVAIKYRYIREMTAEIDASLFRLERFTGAGSSRSDDPYLRLRAIGTAMLLSLEREYRLDAPKDADPEQLTPRLDAVKEAILDRVAAAAGVPMPRGETLPERMRALIHAIETVTRDDPEEKTPYDRELHRQQRERAFPLLHDLRRLANWIAVYDGYVRERPTAERTIDMLVRLERECFGREFLTGPRRCRIRLPEPIDLAARWPDYEANKRATVRAVARDTETRLLAALGS